MKCSNCSADAVYTINDPGVSVIFYCVKCLPASLRARANAGQLDLPKVEEVVEEPKKQTKKKASSKASEPTETPVEEPASEPAAEEAEAPDENPAS